MSRVSNNVIRTIDQRLLADIRDEQEKQTKILERIADVLDAMALEQDTLHQTVEELADFILADEEPPVTAKGEYPLPGFDGDPLAKFPSIRKESNGK